MNAESEKEQKRKKDIELGIFCIWLGLCLVLYGIDTQWARYLERFLAAGGVVFGIYRLSR